MEKKFTSFEGFWPFYVAQHLNATNRGRMGPEVRRAAELFPARA